MKLCDLAKVSILILILAQIGLANPDLEGALKQINKFGRTARLPSGVAPLTASKYLAVDLHKLDRQNIKEYWSNLSEYGRGNFLQAKFTKSDANEPVEVALNKTISKFGEYIGLTPRFIDSEWKDGVELTREAQGNVVYATATMIQSGGQGSVLYGMKRDSENAELVAVKLGPSTLRSEADSYKAIGNHPNIVSLLDAGTPKHDSEAYALVLELMMCDAFDLVELCGFRMSLKSSILFARQMLKAIKHIHQRDFVHRDLKAENILVLFHEGKSILKLGDLGHAKRYRENGIRMENQTTNTRVGTYEYMSTFTQDGSAASPRDDVMSLWFMFIELVNGVLQWHELCKQIVRLSRKSDITKEDWDTIDNLNRTIIKLKEEHRKEFAEEYPELLPFAEHVFNLKFEDDPNHDMLDDCLVKLMQRHGIFDDGVFDWDELLYMFLLDRDVLKVGVEISSTSENEYDFEFKFEKFYACLLAELHTYCKTVEVRDELNLYAQDASKPGFEKGPYSFFQMIVHATALEDIKLEDFQIGFHALNDCSFHAGFGYYYEASTSRFTVTMALTAKIIGNESIGEPTEMSSEVAEDLSDYFQPNFPRENSTLINTIYVFKRHCSLLRLSNLSLSIDETSYEITRKENIVASSSSSSSKTPESAGEGDVLRSCTEFTVFLDDQKSPAEKIITSILEKPETAADVPSNYRICWTPDDETASCSVLLLTDTYFTLARDNYYARNAKDNYSFPLYQLNWTLAINPKLNQLTNDLAHEKYFSENDVTKVLLPDASGLLVFGTRIPSYEHVFIDDRIRYSVGALTESPSNQHLNQVNPHDISAVSFGYAVCDDGSVKSVVAFETYCHEPLRLINDERLKLNKRELTLHEDNFAIAQKFRHNYVGRKQPFLRNSCGALTSPEDIKNPLARTTFSSETPKEALSSYVSKFLKKGVGKEYEMLTVDDKTKISFVIFQSREGGKWKIDIKLY